MILNKKNKPTSNVCKRLQSEHFACKDYKSNTKTLEILVFLLILFFSVFRPLGFTLCSHATNLSSLGSSVLLNKHNNLYCTIEPFKNI